MQLTALAFSLVAALAATPAALARDGWHRTSQATYVVYFDGAHNSVDGIACGVQAKSHNPPWNTIGDIIKGGNKYLVGGPVISDHNADSRCGQCYKIEHGGKHVYATVVDQSSEEWDLSTAAFKFLGGEQAIQDGELTIKVSPADDGEQWRCSSDDQDGEYDDKEDVEDEDENGEYEEEEVEDEEDADDEEEYDEDADTAEDYDEDADTAEDYDEDADDADEDDEEPAKKEQPKKNPKWTPSTHNFIKW